MSSESIVECSTDAAHLTFAQHSDLYVSALAQRKRKPVKPTSIATLRAAFRMANPVLGEMPIGAIESSDLKLLVDSLVDDKYSEATIRLVVFAAKKLIASVVDSNGNPLIHKTWNDEHIDQPDLKTNQAAALTAGQIETAIKQAGPIAREFFIVQAATGLRRGELQALNVEDFDSTNRTLRVTRTRGYFGETSPKTKSSDRFVDLHPDVAALLDKMLAGRTSGRLFDISIDKVRRAFEHAGLKSHGLRHFRYTHLQMSAVPNTIRDYWMGHSAKGMGKIYDHMAQNAELRQQLALKVGLGFKLPKFASPVFAGLEQQTAVAQVST